MLSCLSMQIGTYVSILSQVFEQADYPAASTIETNMPHYLEHGSALVPPGHVVNVPPFECTSSNDSGPNMQS